MSGKNSNLYIIKYLYKVNEIIMLTLSVSIFFLYNLCRGLSICFTERSLMKKDIGWKSYLEDNSRYAENKNALLELITSDEYYKHMDEDALELVTLYTNSKELIEIQDSDYEGGKRDVCKAIQDLMEDSGEGRITNRESQRIICSHIK